MNVYQIVTDKIISILEQGTVPWRKPWATSNALSKNLITNKEYRGINLFLLGCQDFESPYWMSYKQVLAKKGTVRKGEKASQVVFYQRYLSQTEQPENGDKQRTGFMLKYYNVFNLQQCDGIAAPAVEESTVDFTPIKKAEQIVANMNNPPEIRYGSKRASYSSVNDKISMPFSSRFETCEGFYAVLFHELGHSTGHQSRLARKEVMERNEFGSEEYSAEELCAGLSASMLCAVAGISSQTVELSAAYIESWLTMFRTDKRVLIRAAGKAQKAADYILNRTAETGGNHDLCLQGQEA